MKNIRVSFLLRTAGILSALIVLLIGAGSCKHRQQVTKYGPPPIQYQDDGTTITKYGVPMPDADSTMTPDSN